MKHNTCLSVVSIVVISLVLLFGSGQHKVFAEDCYDICSSWDDPQACYDDCVSSYGSGQIYQESGGSTGGGFNMDDMTMENTDNDYGCTSDKPKMINGACVSLEDWACATDSSIGGVGYTYSSWYDTCVGSSGAGCASDADCGGGLSCNSSKCETNIWGKAGSGLGSIWNGTFGSIIPSTKIDLGSWGGSSYGAANGGAYSGASSYYNPNGAASYGSYNSYNPGYPMLSYNSGSSYAPSGGPSASNSNPSGDAMENPPGAGAGASPPSGTATPTGGGDLTYLATKCDPAHFKDVGGVCFPASTGLSEAPVALILTNLLFWLMSLFTILAVAAFVISGIQYLTAAGDATQAETAKKNAKWAIIGVLVGLSGFVIVQAISNALQASSLI